MSKKSKRLKVKVSELSHSNAILSMVDRSASDEPEDGMLRGDIGPVSGHPSPAADGRYSDDRPFIPLTTVSSSGRTTSG